VHSRAGPAHAAPFKGIDLGVESYKELGAKSRPLHSLADPARLAARCKAQIDRRFAEDVG
jgi:hypothetical protein